MLRTLTPWSPRAARSLGPIEFELPAFLDRMFGADEMWPQQDVFVPRTDVVETAGRYDVSVELPGMKPEDVQVEFQNGHLVIHGQKQEETEEKERSFHRVERRFGAFRRVLPMPGPVNEGQVTAQFKDGVLTVAVPKAEASIAKKIEIKA
jgi:HSP20 family protein